jgi:hypothetical protein
VEQDHGRARPCLVERDHPQIVKVRDTVVVCTLCERPWEK